MTDEEGPGPKIARLLILAVVSVVRQTGAPLKQTMPRLGYKTSGAMR